MGGSSDRELTALAVVPNALPSCWAVMTVTPLAKRPMMSRNSLEESLRRSPASAAGVSTLMELLEPEADLDRHLEVGDLAVGEVAADADDLEPLEAAQRLAGLRHGRADAVVDAGRRRPGDLDGLVHVIAQGALPLMVLWLNRRSWP